MSQQGYAILIDLTCAIGWLMVVLPALLYLRRSWNSRRDALFQVMTDGALEQYYRQFSPARNIPSGQRVSTFRRDFGRQYGRRWYVSPLLLLGVLFGFGAWGTAGTLKVWTGVASANDTFAVPSVALSAFLGGVAWVVNDQLDRLRTRDFTSHDVYNCVFRLLLAVPLGYGLGAFCAAPLQVPVAFLLGAFPTSTLFTIARRLGTQKLGLGDASEVRQLGDNDTVRATELEKLQNIGKANAERFNDEGISTIAELAWADPIDLTIRTNRPFNYVVDCISQALLWIYVEDKATKLYVLSLRGAQEVNFLVRGLNSDKPIEREEAFATLTTAAALLGVGEKELLFTLRQVVEDPYTKFLVEIWG
jgi:hypothetical protein